MCRKVCIKPHIKAIGSKIIGAKKIAIIDKTADIIPQV